MGPRYDQHLRRRAIDVLNVHSRKSGDLSGILGNSARIEYKSMTEYASMERNEESHGIVIASINHRCTSIIP
jgi:hypothetical protein